MRAKIELDSVIVRDVGLDCMSVTNDAEAVVRHLLEKYGPKIRIFYYDSSGQLDELVHNGSEFLDFKFGGPK